MSALGTYTLNGFMSRMWEGQRGAKFRSQVRRRVERMGGESRSIEVRNSEGDLIDRYMCQDEYRALLKSTRHAPMPGDSQAAEDEVDDCLRERGYR